MRSQQSTPVLMRGFAIDRAVLVESSLRCEGGWRRHGGLYMHIECQHKNMRRREGFPGLHLKTFTSGHSPKHFGSKVRYLTQLAEELKEVVVDAEDQGFPRKTSVIDFMPLKDKR